MLSHCVPQPRVQNSTPLAVFLDISHCPSEFRMEQFDESCHQAISYPSNLIAPNVPLLELEAIQQELEQQAPRLFCDESSASVDLLEVPSRGQGSCETAVTRPHH
jgi:hypothetical protein